ncbi:MULTISPECIES: hypothetical protein [Lactobacillus]|uniref:Uncharacterized protein n=1 Tax=Lactobacillus johnsonii TaxID=33959 RepID=A0A9X4XAW0_LACJH|nr:MULTISPECIES: hypothetical protein [Lactobacillus]MTE03610.1 hypothetical protein [Lactobacillus johnsonii]
MTDWITNTSSWGLGLVLIAVGLFLIAVGVLDLGRNLKGESKNWGGAIIGLVIAIIGGALTTWGATNFITFFKNGGQEVPRQ